MFGTKNYSVNDLANGEVLCAVGRALPLRIRNVYEVVLNNNPHKGVF